MPIAEARPHFVRLQILRGLAAMSVVLLHASGFAGAPVHAAAFGIDIFFVISGFLMVAITRDRSHPWSFLKDRFLRIVPLYWLATAAMVAWSTLASGVGPPDVSHLVFSLLFIPFRTSSDGGVFPVLTVGWTLNYEMMFYLIFAATLLLPTRRRLLALTACFVLLVMLGLIFQPLAAPLAFWTQPIIVEFLAGAWLARIWRGGCSTGTGLALIGGGALIYCAAYMIVQRVDLDLLVATRVPIMIPAVMIVAGALLLEPLTSSSTTIRVLAALGDASYSVYIWQFSIIYVAVAIAGRLAMEPAALFVLVMVLCIGGGVVLYHLIEKPLMILFRHRKARWRTKGLTISASRSCTSWLSLR